MRLTIYFLIILPLIIFVSKPSYSLDDKDREIILLKNQIDNLKWELKKKNSNTNQTNQDVDKSQSNSNREEIQNLTQKYEKEIIFLKNQISILTKEKNTSDNKILKLTNELEGNDSELYYKSKFEELLLQFESLNDDLENVTKINEQLDNEITSLKNEVDKKNIAEKENKKIVQQKNENVNSEENQNNDNKTVETVSVDIVKDEELINLDVSDFKKLKTTEIEDILYDSVTFGFYSDGALFESQYSPNSKGNEGQFSISFSENEKYTGVYKVTKSKVCFLLDGTDNWECSLIYKKNKNDKIYYWATKGEIFAKTTHILTKSEYAKMDKNPINTKTKSAENLSDNKTTNVQNQETSDLKLLSSIEQENLRKELNFLIENQKIFSNKSQGVENLDYLPDEYINFQNKVISLKSTEKDIYRKGSDEVMKNCGKVITTITFKEDNTATILRNLEKNKPETCNVSNEFPVFWVSSHNEIAYSYISKLDNKTSIFVKTLEIDFERENALLETHVNSDGDRQIYQQPNLDLINFLDNESGKSLPIGRENFYQIKENYQEKVYIETVKKNTKNKTVLFGVSILDDPNNYEISNKLLGEEFVMWGNSFAEIFEADYGQKLEFNFYDTEPPIKNNAFFDYKIRTTSLNGKEIISSINARADCPLKGLEGCTEFSDQVSNALYEKYGFVSGSDFDIIDENGNIYTLSLSMLFTEEGEIIVSGYDYLNADGLWMSLGINWSEESLMSKFEIDPDSKKKVDTNF